jgi:amino acid adenylation domain-containing protein
LRQCIAEPESRVGDIRLPRLAGRYSDWQHLLSSGDTRMRLEAYWRERLSDMVESVRIQPDVNMPSVATGPAAMVSIDLGSSMHDRMDAYARSEDIGRFAAWMSVWQVLQARLGTGGEIVIATPVSERSEPGSPDINGVFLNTLPICARVDAEASFRTFSRYSHRVLAQDLSHAQLPFEDIIRIADIDFGAGSNGLPQVMFTMQDEQDRVADDVDSSGSMLRSRNPIGQLRLHMPGYKAHGRVWLEYDAGMFHQNTAEAILRRFEAVAEQVLREPDIQISDIEILLPGERKRLRNLSGIDKPVSYPIEKTLVDLFDEQANRTPDSIALRFLQTALSYGELNARANQLAHYLIDRFQVVPDRMVGIELPRSEWMVIGLLAIIKAGGAYVPIDPYLPQHRKDFIREDANLGFILDQKELDRFSSACMQKPYPTTNPHVRLRPDNLAYVIYTSGTTGNPKGVMIEHRNVVRLLFNDAFPYDFSHRDKWTMAHNFNFDFSVWEMYGALLYGGELVVVPLEVVKAGRAFTELLIDCGVTVLNQTPSAFYSLSESMNAYAGSNRHRIRYVIFGGEALQPARLEEWHKSSPETRLVNMYGITETTVHVTYKEIGPCEIEEGKSNLGRPIPTISCHVLDEQMGLTPPGQPGELYVGGLGLARGYLNRAELTAERFIPDPFIPGERLYRTGDICRWRENGDLEFLGRKDDQVKIRGFRIELGEVEHALQSCNGVRDAVVRPEPDNMGSNRLRSWVTLKQGFEASESLIRLALSSLLPDYMVPFRIHVVDSIPLTSQGKVDFAALRQISMHSSIGEEAIGFNTATETKISEIWNELLGVEVKHRGADFFRLGGHSLLAIRLAARIRQELGTQLSLSDFYADGRLEALAARIDADRKDALFRVADMPPLSPGEHIPMSAAQRRMFLLQHLLEHPSSYHIALLTDIPSHLVPSDVTSILHGMAERHPILRTRLWQDDDGFWQDVLTTDEWQIDWGVLAMESSEDGDKALSAERERPFDLSKAPAWRARWVVESGYNPQLLLVFHHALVDEWSMNLLRKELAARLGGTPPEAIPRPSYTYADFARWQ